MCVYEKLISIFYAQKMLFTIRQIGNKTARKVFSVVMPDVLQARKFVIRSSMRAGWDKSSLLWVLDDRTLTMMLSISFTGVASAQDTWGTL